MHFNLTTKAILNMNEFLAARSANTQDKIVNRWDFNTLADAQAVVDAFSEDNLLAVDKGAWVSPRFDVIEMPKVGDEVSMGFNGDYYPVGTITNISSSLKVITTSTGKKFYRRKLTGQWLYSQTFTLIAGTHSKMNPEF